MKITKMISSLFGKHFGVNYSQCWPKRNNIGNSKDKPNPSKMLRKATDNHKRIIGLQYLLLN